MDIAIGSVINMTPANIVWDVAFDLGGETGEVVCPVVGWATVVQSRTKAGNANTVVQPAFIWGDQVWTETDLREHAPDVKRFEIRRQDYGF
ncbi:hypothetical protein MBT84_19820 [Streptomyces sp. MBT84]|uniref:hypothetical protein n=1 Tax=Streptomyces sp. MBT84 TaxID=1488414 RepID=UPI001C6E3123|nr:hypothetical protein [Streptomyces sp. MBT84]MBW8701858.1 hypothetical protein [Streptomyces sp. MBT84]